VSVLGSLAACSEAELSLTQSSEEADAGQSSILTEDVDLRQKATDEKYTEQLAELKRAEEDLRMKEELYKHEDEAMLEKLTAHSSFIEKLDVRKVQLMYFIESQAAPPAGGLETSMSASLCRSEGQLSEFSDDCWQEQACLPRSVFSASGRLLTTSKHGGVECNPAQNGATCWTNSTNFTAQLDGFESRPKQHCGRVLTQAGKIDQEAIEESSSDLGFLPELSVPWRLLSDDVKSRSASAPRLSDEASSASLLSDETRTILLRRLARSPSPRTCQLSSLSLVSVPESIHEEREESPLSGRLSVSEVDIRRHQFAVSNSRDRWSLDEAHLSGQNTAASIRCVTGSKQDVVITDSGLPSSPEAGRLDSSVSSDMNAVVKRKQEASKQFDVTKSLRKPGPSILQKIGATLTSLTRRQLVSSKKQTPVSSQQSSVSHPRSDVRMACNNRFISVGKTKVQGNSALKADADQSKSKSKQPVRNMSKMRLSTYKGRTPSDTAEKKNKSASRAQDKSTMPAKVRESFRSFRKRLKLTAEKGLRRKSDDISVEIFLPKRKVVESSEDCRDLCAAEEQTDTCISDEVTSWNISTDADWRDQLTGVFRLPHDVQNLEITDGCDDDGGLFSDDSLNGRKNVFYDETAGLGYEDIVGPAYDDHCFLPFFQQDLSKNTNCDDGSFSEDSLAEDAAGCSTKKELGQKPTSVLLPWYNAGNASPVSIATRGTGPRVNRQFEASIHDLISRDIVESKGQSALCSGIEEAYDQCEQTGALTASGLEIASVSRVRATPQTTGALIAATECMTDDITSASAARYFMFMCVTVILKP